MYLLDTNIISFFIKQNPIVAAKIASKEKSILLCVITQAESLFGAKKAGRQELVDLYKTIYDTFPNLSFDPKSCEIFTDLKAQHSILGQIIEDFDLMIAAICLANDLILVTNNTKHFKRIKGLKVEDWCK